MARFEINSWVWITDEKERYLPAKVLVPFTKGTPTTVLLEDGDEAELSAAESALVSECNEEALSSAIEDLVNISDLNEMSILHCLRIRFKEDKIYTNISSILISVNPFKMLPLFTPQILDQYRQGYRGKAPHVFGIGYNAFHDMLNDNRDQSVVISGESGSGKTEATKLILQFITDISSKNSKESPSKTKQSLEQQILAANPILEALGNAKTLRNNNSSRFGKLITVNFDRNGQIIGGNIINYLLEKSRVVHQTEGERNYHVFYQLIAAGNINPDLQEELKLQDAELFSYTGQSGSTKIKGISDEKDFDEVQNSMNILQFTAEEKKALFKIIAGVLHFGNVKFKVEQRANAEDSCTIANLDVLAIASSLWGIDEKMIEKYLTSRNVASLKEVIAVNYNITQALDARDAMVKRVYSELFQFVVDRINISLSAGGVKRHKFIGVLDIFGFESFVVNSFEQLCVNLCNEKLQFHFNEYIFKIEQNLYAQEGVVISGSTFVDNKPTLDLLEAKVTGVFSMIDEEISVPKGSDDSLLNKILQKHADGKHPNMIRPKAKDCKDFLKNFGILHYAGPVFYNVTGFLEKNKDQLHPDILGVLREATFPLMKKLFPAEAATGSSKGGTKKITLGGQFKNQLNDLIDTLNATNPHFIRCMKSNDDKVGDVFTSSRMQDQLRYAGLVEVCRIRKLGYPVRRPFSEFFKRYKCCDLLASTLDKLLASLSAKKILIEGEWAKGKTRIFMRTPQASQLEIAREASLVKVTIVIQKYSRRLIFRRRYKNMKKILAAIRDAMTKREESAISSAIESSYELPFGGGHVKTVKDAKVLLARIQEEKHIVKLLENAISLLSIPALKAAIDATKKMSPPFHTPLLSQAQELMTKLEKEAETRAQLKEAINKRDLEKLTIWIAKAEEIEMVSNELPQAVALKARILEENDLLAKVKEATKSEDFDLVNDLISKCAEMGLSDRSETKAAKSFVDRIASSKVELAAIQQRKREQEEAAAAKRREAIEETDRLLVAAKTSTDIAFITAALEAAMKLGLQNDDVAAAQAQLQVVQTQQESAFQLHAAMQAMQVMAEQGMDNEDLEQLTDAIKSASSVEQAVGNAEVDALKAELNAARDAFAIFQKQVEIRAALVIAIKTRDRDALVAAIADANDINYTCAELTQATEIIHEVDAAKREKTPETYSMDEEPTRQSVHIYDIAEEERKKRHALAKKAKFSIKYFPGLRTPEDFAKGTILSKGKVKENFLTYQNTVIPKSLCDLTNKEANKAAVEIFKELLGYMGDLNMKYPAMLAQDILQKGYRHRILRDEIYLQIIKQLTSNPRPESLVKGYQLLSMAVGTFPPSFEFENYLLHFILEKCDRGRGGVADYAKYCLRTLEAILANGDGSGFVPSVQEIEAYKERPPILATIYLVDGNIITENLPITPDMNVGKVLEMCTGWLELRDERVSSFGIFVYDMGEIEGVDNPFANAPYRDLLRTPRPLRNEDYMGDVIVLKARQRRKFMFVLKKKIFLPQHNYVGDDPLYERLVYLQAEDEAIIQGNISFTDANQVAELGAISVSVAYGEGMGKTVEELVSAGVYDFIPLTMRHTKTPEQWAKLILPLRAELVSMGTEDLQQRFLNIVRNSPDYGSHWFYVHKIDPPFNQPIPKRIRQLPRSLILAFNVDGMTIFDRQRKRMFTYPFPDIYRWGGSSSQFSLILADEAVADSFEFTLVTAQAVDMASVILDYVRAIMEAEEEG